MSRRVNPKNQRYLAEIRKTGRAYDVTLVENPDWNCTTNEPPRDPEPVPARTLRGARRKGRRMLATYNPPPRPYVVERLSA